VVALKLQTHGFSEADVAVAEKAESMLEWPGLLGQDVRRKDDWRFESKKRRSWFAPPLFVPKADYEYRLMQRAID